MNYQKTKRRLQNAIIDAEDGSIESDTLQGILAAFTEGPLAPGDTVDSSLYSQKIDSEFLDSATVLACWHDESTGMWFVVVEDQCWNWASANTQWFTKIEEATESTM